MSRVHDKDPELAEPVAAEPAATDSAPTERAGRVEVDNRGRNVWRWARDVIESTSVLLKRLENTDLALEPTQKVPIVPGPDQVAKGSKQVVTSAASKPGAPKPAPSKTAPRHPALPPGRGSGSDDGGGFDPYNSR
jgi:hypothetical protein